MSLHQLVAGRRCDPAVEHTPVRMYKGKDCVYCKVTCDVKKQTTCQCSKCEASLCFFTRNCFHKFHQKSFIEDRRGGLPVNLFLSLLGDLQDDLKEAQCKKDMKREKERTDEFRMFQSIIFTFISREYITEVFETIFHSFLAVISFSNKTLMD